MPKDRVMVMGRCDGTVFSLDLTVTCTVPLPASVAAAVAKEMLSKVMLVR